MSPRSASLVVFLAAAVWFGWNAAPGVTFEDAGELAAATVTGGVPHPPGYPLQMLVGRAFVALASPFTDDPARALNLLSALASAGAAALVALLVGRVTRSAGGALAAGALLVAAPTFAAQAVVTEVYALASLLVAALAVTALTAERATTRSAFLLGLATCAHASSVLAAPLVLVAFARERDGGARAGALVLRAAGAALVGLLPFAWVPLAAAADPPLNWGDPSTLSRFFDHLARTQYDAAFAEDASARVGFLAEQLAGQWPLALAAALVALALLRPAEGARALGPLAATLAAVTLGLYATNRFAVGEEAARWRLAGSYSLLVVLTSAIAGLGFAALARRLGDRVPTPAATLVTPLVALALALPAGPRTLAGAVHQRDATQAEAYARETLDACPPDAILVVNRLGYSDVLHFPLLYLQLVRGEREDVLVLNRDLLAFDWFREQLARREPELASLCVRLSGLLARAPAADPQARRIATATFFPALARVSDRPIAFVTRPGARLLGEGARVVPGPVLWHLERGGETVVPPASPPGGAWLPEEDRNPWIAELRRLTAERERAR